MLMLQWAPYPGGYSVLSVYAMGCFHLLSDPQVTAGTPTADTQAGSAHQMAGAKSLGESPSHLDTTRVSSESRAPRRHPRGTSGLRRGGAGRARGLHLGARARGRPGPRPPLSLRPPPRWRWRRGAERGSGGSGARGRADGRGAAGGAAAGARRTGDAERERGGGLRGAERSGGFSAVLRVTAPRARPPAAAGRGGRGGGGRRRSVPGGAPAVAAAAGSARPRDGGEAGRESTRCEAAAASGRRAACPSRRRWRRPRIRPAGLCPGRAVTAEPGQPRRRPRSPAGPERHRGEWRAVGAAGSAFRPA